jgi:hypothetical protein
VSFALRIRDFCARREDFFNTRGRTAGVPACMVSAGPRAAVRRVARTVRQAARMVAPGGAHRTPSGAHGCAGWRAWYARRRARLRRVARMVRQAARTVAPGGAHGAPDGAHACAGWRTARVRPRAAVRRVTRTARNPACCWCPTRRVAVRGRRTPFARSAKLQNDRVAERGQVGHAVEVDVAVGVVGLVLKNSGCEVGHFQLRRIAFVVEAA